MRKILEQYCGSVWRLLSKGPRFSFRNAALMVDRAISILSIVVFTVAPVLVQAQQLPTGGSVAAGSASISSPNSSTLNVNQSSDRAIINWNSFSVGAGGTVNFNQPSASSATLNRVTGNTPSSIAGTINAPGTVLLVNPNGVAITKDGVVNVGSFAASTLDIKNDDFMAGNYKFSGNGNSLAVTNAGRINVSDGGFAALLGGQVANDGVITARLGKVALGSGELITLDLAGDGFMSVAVPTKDLGKIVGADGQTLVSNRGKIVADGGLVSLSAATAAGLLRDAVNVPGSISARSVSGHNGRIIIGGGAGGRVRIAGRVRANGRHGRSGGSIVVTGADVNLTGRVSANGGKNGGKGGSVTVVGDQSVEVDGTVSAKGNGSEGGVVILTADQVTLGGSAKVDASGTTGGTLLIGGDYQGGANAASNFSITPVKNALTTTIDAGATLNASGTNGDGGHIVVWSNDQTTFAGALDVTGINGQGGFAEVSGHRLLDFTGTVDLAGTAGAGTLLLDPENITISSGSDSGVTASGGTYTAGADSSVLSVATLQAALASGNVIVTTGGVGSAGAQAGDITVANDVTWSSGNSLTLDAYRNIAVNANVTNTAGAAVTLRADNSGTGTGTVTFGVGNTISTSGAVAFYYNPTGSNVTVNTVKYSSGSQTNYSGNVTGGASLTSYMLVNTVFDLQNIRNNLTGVYALGRDIDASVTSSWNSGAGFVSIGTDGAGGVWNGSAFDTNTSSSSLLGFTGQFDGLGHSINGLTVNLPDVNYGGLFGYSRGQISNVNIVNAHVLATAWAAGLVGRNYGTISNSSSNGTIVETSSGANSGTGSTGGLAGSNYGTITNSYSSGTVTANVDDNTGGLVGWNSGTISNSYSIATVAGAGSVGGLVGHNAVGGTISDSYATGNVSGGFDIGGLIGSFTYGSTIRRVYASGAVSGGGSVGGLFGSSDTSATVARAYWDTTSTGQTSACGDRSTCAGTVALQSSDPTGAKYAYSQSSYSGFDFTNTWAIVEGTSRPTLAWQVASTPSTLITGHVYSDLGTTFAGDGTIVNALLNGVSLGLTTTSNGYYQFSFAAGSLDGSKMLITYTTGATGGAALAENASGSVSNLNIYGNALAVTTSSSALSTVYANLTTGIGASGFMASYPSLVIDVTGSSFNIDQAVSQSGTLKLNGTGTLGATAAVNVGSYVQQSGDWVQNTGMLPAFSATNFSVTGGSFLRVTGGDGSSAAPYQVSDVYGLQGIGTSVTGMAGYWQLANDIDASGTANWNNGAGFVPLATDGAGHLVDGYYSSFDGNFDGQGHIISGLTINRPTADYVGLFGWSNGTIANVGLVGGSVTGQDYTGALVGSQSDGAISNAYATGSVSGRVYVGGLVGSNGGPYINTTPTITSSYATGAVSGQQNVGGLVGEADGTISKTFATGAVTATTNSDANYGGLVGVLVGLIDQSFATGAVIGADDVGGLVGAASGTVSNSYATGTATATEYGAGGLVGASIGANFSSVYATGGVSSPGPAGGLIGYTYGGAGSFTNSYWDTDTNRGLSAIGADNYGQGGQINGVTTAVLSSANVLAALNSNAGVWANQNNQTTPYLGINPGPVFLASDSTRLYQPISNVNQLQAISNNLSGNYLLISDIDASATAAWNNGAGFAPLGTFTGNFNGLGHVVSDLTIYRPSTDYVGLFSNVDFGATVSNIVLTDVSVTGHADVGGLAGFSRGAISGASVSGIVTGAASSTAYGTGGLIGYSGYLSTIANSSSSATVSGGNSVGGLVGDMQGITISNSYASGSVHAAYSFAGGLVGYGNINGQSTLTISNSYATGSVNGSTVGGLIGGADVYGGYQSLLQLSNVWSSGAVTGTTTGGVLGQIGIAGTYNGVYWDTTTTGQSSAISGASTPSGITALQSADSNAANYAFTQASYSGFDFTNTWTMIDGQTRPFLRNEYSTTITNAHQLQLMALDPTASYTLAANIDASGTDGATNPSGMWTSAGFVPIGSDSVGNILNGGNGFTGSFNGLGHTISGLTINRFTGNMALNSGYVGLFGYATDATISNVGLVGGQVTGDYYVGALVGAASGATTISSSYASASVHANNYVGGLVGFARGGVSITSSHATGDVYGYDQDVGGLVGWSMGSIASSYASGNVSGGPNVHWIGGLVGYLSGYLYNQTDSITSSYATGTVTGNSAVGGLVGNTEYGSIADSYATGAVAGSDTVGGLVGSNGASVSRSFASGAVNLSMPNYLAAGGGLVGVLTASGSLTDTYATGTVTGVQASYLGGLVGRQTGGSIATSYAAGSVIDGSPNPGSTYLGGLVGAAGGGTISNAYYDRDSTGQSNACGDSACTGVTALQSNSLTAGHYALSQASYGGFDFNSVWSISEGTSYPYLTNTAPPTVPVPQFQVVSGYVYSDLGATLVGSGVTVNALLNGVSLGSVTTSGGRYQFSVSAGSLDGSKMLIAYTVDANAGAALAENASGSIANLNIYANALTVTTASSALSTVNANLTTAIGSSGIAATYQNLVVNATAASGFSIDTNVNLAGTFQLSAAGDVSGNTGYITADRLAISTTSSASNVNLSGSVAHIGDISLGGGSLRYYSGTANPTLDGTVTANGGVTFIGNSLTLASGSQIVSSATGNAVILDLTTNFINNAGSNAISAPNGRWIVYSASVAGDVFGNLDSGNHAIFEFASDGLPYYNVPSGNRYVFSETPVLTITSTDATKTYGDVSDVSSHYTITGFQGVANAFLTDTAASVGIFGAPTLSSTGTAANASVIGGGYTINVVDSGTLGTSGIGGGYTFYSYDGSNLVSSGKLTVNPLAVSLSGTRSYNGTTDVAGSILSVTNAVGGDTITVSGTATNVLSSADASATPYAMSSLTGLTLSNSNYTLTGGSGSVTVTPAAVVLTLNGSKSYDGNAIFAAADFGAGGTISTGVGGQTLILTGSGSVASSHVSAGTQALTVGTLTLTDGTGLASNYQIAASGNTGTITPVSLTASIIGTPTKAYDGTTDAALTAANFSLSGLVNANDLSVTQTAGAYNSSHVATATTVTASLSTSDFSLGGSAQLTDYVLPATASGAGAITPVSLTASIIGTPTKAYDGTTDAALTAANFSLTGLVNANDLSVTQTAGAYNSSHVATATTVTASLATSDFSLGGAAQLTDYVLPVTASGAGAITPVSLTASIIGNPTRAYDGTTDAALTAANFSLSGLVNASDLAVTQTAGVYNSSHVASATTVTASLATSDFSLGGSA
ncbi:MAG: filamentous hemagglutinin N-terminal domain-containing protein, partial [Rhodopseudomonas sp.]|nr:filamentous hemagglutinin N-terminal domain-containing protein [Rhodopseudomonas sp.]